MREILTKVIQEFMEEKKKKNVRVILLLRFINTPPCAPVSESEGLVRLWRLWAKTDLAPSGGGQAGNMWQLICANKHLWRRRRRKQKTPAGVDSRATCTDLHCASDSEGNLTNITGTQTQHWRTGKFDTLSSYLLLLCAFLLESDRENMALYF